MRIERISVWVWTNLEQVWSTGLDGEGAEDRGDDSGEELENLNDGIPIDFHNEYNNNGYQKL